MPLQSTVAKQLAKSPVEPGLEQAWERVTIVLCSQWSTVEKTLHMTCVLSVRSVLSSFYFPMIIITASCMMGHGCVKGTPQGYNAQGLHERL